MSKRPPLVLAILDGWGMRADPHGNAIAGAELPNWHRMLERYPHTRSKRAVRPSACRPA